MSIFRCMIEPRPRSRRSVDHTKPQRAAQPVVESEKSGTTAASALFTWQLHTARSQEWISYRVRANGELGSSQRRSVLHRSAHRIAARIDGEPVG